MQILSIDGYFDGGTISVITDQGDYYVDGRIGSPNRTDIYPCYPDDGKMFKDQIVVRANLLTALKAWKSPSDWKDAVEKLIDRLS